MIYGTLVFVCSHSVAFGTALAKSFGSKRRRAISSAFACFFPSARFQFRLYLIAQHKGGTRAGTGEASET